MNITPAQILVVDDNATNRLILSRMLIKHGHDVEFALNGREALEKLGQKPFDMVLLDIVMPEMDGYQVLEYLKNDPVLRHIPVIMISSVGEIESVVKCITMGAEDYLQKPFNKVLLNARVNASLEKKRFRDQEQEYLRQLSEERKRSDELLHVILPEIIIRELKSSNAVKPRRFENVAVLFCDIVGFTSYCDKHPPEIVVFHLQELIKNYEKCTLDHNVQKIKTIGDAFMAAAGLLDRVENPVLNCVKLGLQMVSLAPQFEPQWQVRVGIHVGSVMAGIIGDRQYLFDIWGDTVNTAQRVEHNGAINAVNVSKAAWQQITDVCQGQSTGLFEIKGKGKLEIFQVEEIHVC
ncbi:adenylate/guanylate cyclase domain-containing protein [candidate division CSSED10-310 bacterium]|uniref:Adenylate/guanylate cyclase domain-containing protein n=1 Tax=candidate division CSSED10-310 bacterium TaxID=2855610 RepID=A0ABV6YU51_UNCC1